MATATLAPRQLDERDWVNPYLSPLRLWVSEQLANLLPNNVKKVSSNDKTTKEFFKQWTGHTQESLEAAWLKDGFERVPKDPKIKYQPPWRRVSGVACTTSCEGLINKTVAKLKMQGFGGPKLAQRKPLGSFNLPGLQAGTGKEPHTTIGWHWAREISDTIYPQPGDFFQVGTLFKPGQWTLHHVGVIMQYTTGIVPTWTTVEAGQGGPSAGCDCIQRKGPRPVNPIDPKKPGKVMMGWLNIEEYFDIE